MSGQSCRAEAKLAAPVAVRLAPQNLDKTKDKIIHCCTGVKVLVPHSLQGKKIHRHHS